MANTESSGRDTTINTSNYAETRNARGKIEPKTFCLFIGAPRSGSSVVGAIIDAHRQASISHEFDVLGVFQERCPKINSQMFTEMVNCSRRQAEAGRLAGRYSYAISGAHQGDCADIKVLGDKEGEWSSLRLSADLRLYDQFCKFVDLPVRIVHTVRNPFDNIATIYLLNRKSGLTSRNFTFDEACGYYFEVLATASQEIIDRIGVQNVHTIYHEELLSDPRKRLLQLSKFLDIEPDEAWVQVCTRLLFKRPSRSRFRISWTDSMVEKVRVTMQAYEHLNCRY